MNSKGWLLNNKGWLLNSKGWLLKNNEGLLKNLSSLPSNHPEVPVYGHIGIFISPLIPPLISPLIPPFFSPFSHTLLYKEDRSIFSLKMSPNFFGKTCVFHYFFVPLHRSKEHLG